MRKAARSEAATQPQRGRRSIEVCSLDKQGQSTDQGVLQSLLLPASDPMTAGLHLTASDCVNKIVTRMIARHEAISPAEKRRSPNSTVAPSSVDPQAKQPPWDLNCNSLPALDPVCRVRTEVATGIQDLWADL